jgi:trans-2,3-dihydro-3-hydroxyanthranilate isomerase
MARYRFHQLDVFTRTPLTGNPLAVFPHASGLDAATMQALAREMNLSETTFVTPSAVATRRVRFFTPTAEIPLAGHPTIGTWWLLAETGEIELPETGEVRVTQETGAGVLPVDLSAAAGNVTQAIMTQARPAFGSTVDDVGLLGTALGGDGRTIAPGPPPQVVSTALPQLMVPIRSLAHLAALPSGGGGPVLTQLLRALGTDCAMCFAMEATTRDASVHCRMFAPGLGVMEDPATGSAAGALGAFLVRHALVKPHDGIARITMEQGLEIGRPSIIHVEVRTDETAGPLEVRVGGEAVTVITGEVSL